LGFQPDATMDGRLLMEIVMELSKWILVIMTVVLLAAGVLLLLRGTRDWLRSKVRSRREPSKSGKDASKAA
jgi:uncharacterized membrane protein